MQNLARILEDEDKGKSLKRPPLFLVKGGIVPSAQTLLEENQRRRKSRFILAIAGACIITISVVLLEDSTSIISNLFVKEVDIPTPNLDYQQQAQKRAITLLKENNFQSAAGIYEKLLQKAPKSKSARMNHGYALTKLRRFKEAEKEYLAVLREHRDDALALNNLGVLYASSGQLEKAQETLERALRVSPNYLDARLNLAAVYEKGKRWNLAVNAYKELMSRQSPGEVDSYKLKERMRRLQSLAKAEMGEKF